MASDSLHAPPERLSKDTLHMHHAIVSLMEEMEAVEELKEILLHNMREEMQHACMVLEWLCRNNKDFAKELK